MNAKVIKHSKIKNSGILFEMLVRRITVDMLEGRYDTSPATRIVQKYFHAGTELGKELQLYRSFFEAPPRLTENKAIQFIDLISKQRKKIDSQKLAVEKYDLVREISENYDLDELLSAKIPFYKVYASIYKNFLSDARTTTIANIQEVAKSRFTLIEHLVAPARSSKEKPDELTELLKKQDEDVRLLSYKLLIDRFNERYRTLDESQQKLLHSYINSVYDSDGFLSYIHEEATTVRDAILSKAQTQDKITRIKLNQVSDRLTEMSQTKVIAENHMTSLMIAYEMLKELDREVL